MYSQPKVTYKFNSSFHLSGFAYLAIGTLALIISINMPVSVFAITFSSILMMIYGVFMLIFYGNKNVLKVYDKYIEFKYSPSRAWKTIKDYQIKRVIVTNKIILIELKSNSSSIKLNKRLFDKSDVSRVIVNLRQLVPSASLSKVN